jgi:hypothetical protein
MVERQLPKLDVAGSIPVARSILLNNSRLNFQELEKPLEPSRKTSRRFSLRNRQPPELKVVARVLWTAPSRTRRSSFGVSVSQQKAKLTSQVAQFIEKKGSPICEN